MSREVIPCYGHPSGRHCFQPDTRIFFKAWCVHCGVCREERNLKTAYLCRKEAKRTYGLCDLVASLDERSVEVIRSAADPVGIWCDDDVLRNATVFEGLLPQSVNHERGIPILREIFRSRPEWRIKKVDVGVKVYPRWGETEIKLELQPPKCIKGALYHMALDRNCVLPQDSICVVVGRIDHRHKKPRVAAKELRKSLLGKTLTFNPRGLHVGFLGEVIAAQGEAAVASSVASEHPVHCDSTVTSISRCDSFHTAAEQDSGEGSSPVLPPVNNSQDVIVVTPSPSSFKKKELNGSQKSHQTATTADASSMRSSTTSLQIPEDAVRNLSI